MKRSQYNVQDYYVQIAALARTALRSIIGSMRPDEANSQRDMLKSEARLGAKAADLERGHGRSQD